jgi:hypothetical protein
MYIALDDACTTDQLEALRDLVRQVDLAPGPGGSRITPLTPAQTATALDLLARDPATVLDVRAIALYPSSQLVAHCDPPIPGTRLHLPLVTNPGCWSFSEGLWRQPTVGVFYAMDPSLIHGAVNWGATTRIHLMLDLA